MSRSVDDRIVRLQFDNKEFEKHAQTSMSTLDKLKKSLEFKNVAKGFQNVNNGIQSITFSPIQNGIDAVTSHFSRMEMTWSMVLANMINKAIDAGTKMVNALTIDPVKTGFQEYETQMNAIQTIWANTKDKGTSMEDITQALDELNRYADQTIYNFTQMTNNIGRFTAAGVELDTAVTAIKGISNLAAISGASAEDASRAMYQLSQAMASGTIKLMDWNSVVNANMGGEGFQNVLKETAREHGIAVDAIIKQSGSFRESLSKEWLTTEVLVDALEKYTDTTTELGRTATDAATKVKTFTQLWDTLKESVQSGWSESWRLIIGDFEEARNIFTKLSDALQGFLSPFAEARNAVLRTWAGVGDSSQKTSEHIDDVSESINELDEVAMRVIRGDYKNGIEIRFPLLEADGYDARAVQQRVNEIIYGVKKASDDATKAVTEPVVDPLTGLTGREMVIKGLEASLKRVAFSINLVREAFRDVFPAMTAERLIELSRRFMEFSQRTILTGESAENLKRTLRGFFAIFDIIIKRVKGTINTISRIIGIVDPLNSGILSITGNIGDLIYSFDKTVLTEEYFENSTEKTINVLKRLSEWVSNIINSLGEFLNVDFEKMFINVKNAATTVFNEIKDLIESMKKEPVNDVEEFTERVTEKFEPINRISNFFSGLWEGIKAIIDKVISGTKFLATMVKDTVTNMENPFKDLTLKDIWNLDKIFAVGSLGMAGVSITKFFLNFSKTIGDSGFLGLVGSLRTVLDSVAGVFVSFQNSIKANILLKIAAAIGVLALSLIAISAIKEEPLKNAMMAIGELFAGIILSLKTLNGVEIAGLGGMLTGLALAVTSLTGSILLLGAFSSDTVSQGLSVILTLLFSIAGAIKLMSGGTGTTELYGVGAAIFSFASAINMLLIPMITLSLLADKTNLWAGFGVIALTIGVLTGAITILAAVFKSIDLTKMPGIFLTLIGFASAIQMITVALIAINAIDPFYLGESLAALGLITAGLVVSMVLLAGAAKLGGKGFVGVVFGITALVGAITLLLPQIAALSLIPGDKLMNTAKALSLLMLAFAASGAIIGVFAKPLAILTGVISVFVLSAAAFISSVVNLIKVIKSLAKSDLTGISDRIGEICDAIINNGPKLKEAFITIIESITGAIVDTIDTVLHSITEIIYTVLYYVENNVGTIIESLVSILSTIIVTLLDSLSEKLPEITDSVVNFIIVLINSVADSIEERSDEIIDAIGNLINSLVVILSKTAVKLIELGGKLISNLWAGLKSGLNKIAPGLGEFPQKILEFMGIWGLIQTFKEFFTDVFEGFSEGIGPGLENLKSAVGELLSNLWDWLLHDSFIANILGGIVDFGKSLVTKICDGVEVAKDWVGEKFELIFDKVQAFIKNPIKEGKKLFDSLWDFGGELIDKIANGISAFLYKIGDGIGSIGTKLKTWIAEHTIIDEFIQAGKDFIQGIIDGITDKFGDLKDKVIEVATWVPNKFKSLWDINSPSKVMIPMGSAIDEGVAVGIQKGASYIDKSINTMSDDMYTSLSKTMGDLNDAIYTDIDYEPQIKPVLNLDDVTRNANYLNGMFTNQEIALRQLGASMSTRVSFDEIQNGRYSDQNVLTELRNLRSDITNLNSAMSHMQVVMDSGALVGSIAAPMDSALGRRHIYSRRGV